MANYQLNDAMQSMQKIHNQLNNRMSLTPTQLKQQKIQELRDNYINAQNKVQHSPEELDQAERAYYLESQGSDYYSNMKKKKI